MREKKIIRFDIQNIDETRFWISYRKAQLVIIIDPNKPFRIIDSDNRDYITLVECIGSTGKTISPMLLVFGVNILHQLYHDNDLDRSTLIGTTESGYANNDTVLE